MNFTWTNEEKGKLLEALKKYGVHDLELLSSAVPSKSVAEIETAILSYERAAMKTIKDDDTPGERQAPIDKWLKFMKIHTTDTYTHRDLVTALKIIALLEEKNNRTNYTCCYEYIIDLMNGKSPKQLDEDSMRLLMSCFNKLAMDLKSEDTDKQEEFLANIQVSNILQKTYLSKKGNVVGDPNLNLLKVPLSLLKFKAPN